MSDLTENNKKNGEDEKMPLVKDKLTNKAHPLDKQKRELLKQLAGSASFELDLNKVREQDKHGENRL
ncbi:hypothetical protein ACFY5J_27030 [Peribacillus butanolivorans]|uniref:hypothetical protein n=1 Tax=Peribacillus butanolivorans TaxID=421767 RepID=UPI0036CAC711